MGCIVTRGDPHFALLLLRHIDLAVITKPGPVPAISEGEVGEIRVVFPPLPEQTAIVECLDKATADIDAAVARARRQVELLQEYRTRLIADVVTGKLDVREAAARLPNEADDRDPIDERGRLAENIDGSVRVTNEAVGDLATVGEVTV